MKLVEGIATVEDVDAFVAELGDVASDHGVTVQAFDAEYVLDREHLARAMALADRAIDRGENVARERAVEVLLYAAGRRQIERALEMGVSEGRCPVVILVADDRTGGVDGGSGDGPDAEAGGRSDAEQAAAAEIRDLLEPAETLGAYDPERVREFFDVGEAELAATDADLADLVGERVALLTVER